VTISLGVATLGIDADDVAGLIEKADTALYEAKRQGRDRVAMAIPHQLASA
jgi:diguanylate cyclase (GGDEF)-like protein